MSVTEGNAGTTNAVFTLSLSYASALPASISFSTANGTATGGSDYVPTNGIVNFPPGTTNQTVTVRVNGDLINEPAETFLVNLSNPSNATLADNHFVFRRLTVVRMYEVEKCGVSYSVKQRMRAPLPDLIPSNLRHNQVACKTPNKAS